MALFVIYLIGQLDFVYLMYSSCKILTIFVVLLNAPNTKKVALFVIYLIGQLDFVYLMYSSCKILTIFVILLNAPNTKKAFLLFFYYKIYIYEEKK